MMTRLEKLRKDLEAHKRKAGHIDSVSEDLAEARFIKGIACFVLAGAIILAGTILMRGAWLFVKYAQPIPKSLEMAGPICFLLLVMLPFLVPYFNFLLKKRRKGFSKMSVRDYDNIEIL